LPDASKVVFGYVANNFSKFGFLAATTALPCGCCGIQPIPSIMIKHAF
jgi:hypothetical protein